MRRLALPFCIALGISLFHPFTRLTVPGLGVTVSLAVSDVIVGGLVLYTLFRLRVAPPSPVTFAVLFLALALLLSGAVNGVTDPTFDVGSFFANFVRVMALVSMVVLLPTWARWMGHGRLAQGTLWVARLHSVLIIADSFLTLPLRFEGDSLVWSLALPDAERPQGMFGESSFFGVYMALSLFYILQVERNSGVRHIRVLDIGLFSLALVASDSVSSSGVLFMFVGTLLLRGKIRQRLKAAAAIAVFAAVLLALALIWPEIGPAQSLDNSTGRVLAVMPGRFTDGSGRQRLLGSSMLALEVLRDSPLVGTGLGGSNADRVLVRYRQDDPRRGTSLSLTTMPAAVAVAVGLLGLLPLVFVYGWALASAQTRLIGMSLVLVGLMWGGVFEPVLWWSISLAVSLKRGRTKVVTRLPARRRILGEATAGAA